VAALKTIVLPLFKLQRFSASALILSGVPPPCFPLSSSSVHQQSFLAVAPGRTHVVPNGALVVSNVHIASNGAFVTLNDVPASSPN
jgi:hypothetical protein